MAFSNCHCGNRSGEEGKNHGAGGVLQNLQYKPSMPSRSLGISSEEKASILEQRQNALALALGIVAIWDFLRLHTISCRDLYQTFHGLGFLSNIITLAVCYRSLSPGCPPVSICLSGMSQLVC